jgi:hypothetical protein
MEKNNVKLADEQGGDACRYALCARLIIDY